MNDNSTSIRVSVFLISVILLFPGFYSNFWGVVSDTVFTDSLKDTEAHVVGRIVKSRRDGLFSAGGLLGIVKNNGQHNIARTDAIDIQREQSDWDKTLPFIDFQYAAFQEDLKFDSFSVYLSQSGGQGMFYSMLDQLLPFSSSNRLTFLYILNALLSAIALSLIVLWFQLEFDFRIAFVILISIVFSQWLVLFGRNLWWNIWSFYAPMIAMMYFLKYNLPKHRLFLLKLGVIILNALILKYMFSGMEYITTTLIMMMVPFFYYGYLKDYKLKKFVVGFSWSVLVSIFTFFICLFILSLQIGSVIGTFGDGLDHIIFSALSRTHGGGIDLPEKYLDDVNSSTIDVFVIYLKGVYFDFNNYQISLYIIPKALLKVRYSYLIALFLMSTVYLGWICYNNKNEDETKKIMAILLATWIAFLAPLSWFVIFKAHSHVHIHMNFILWQMPFTIFGFASVGISVIEIMKSLKKIKRAS